MDTVFRIAAVATYGYLIVLSLWAMRVQRAAAAIPHRHYDDHLPMKHEAERLAHGYVAGVLITSLLVRLAQLSFDITLWLLVPLTLLVVFPTFGVLRVVWRMGIEDMNNWYITGLNKLKTVVLVLCTAAVFLDQAWRMVTLFWF